MGIFLSAKKQKNEQICLVCDQTNDKGIHLLNYFICEQCEREITLTNPSEKNYRYYLKHFKKVRHALIEMKKDMA